MQIQFYLLFPLFLIRSATACCGTDFFMSGNNAFVCDSFVNPADSLVQLDMEKIDFGTMKMGDMLSVQVSFTNIGQDTLAIEIVSACECMEVEWTKEPIAPGGRGSIDVLFDTSGMLGSQTKDIDLIFRNVDWRGYPLVKQVRLQGEVR